MLTERKVAQHVYCDKTDINRFASPFRNIIRCLAPDTLIIVNEWFQEKACLKKIM